MLDNYTVTENSDNRFKFIPIKKEDDIIISSTCTHVFLLPFLYSEYVLESNVIYRQGLTVVLVLNSDRYHIEENLERRTSKVVVELTPEETKLFHDNLLTVMVQLRIINKVGEVLYNKPNKLILRRPLNILNRPNTGIPQGDIDIITIKELEEKLEEHINDTIIHVQPGDREFWDNETNYINPEGTEILEFIRR